MNLLRVERTIASNNVIDKDIVNDINIDYVPFDKMLSIVEPHEDDPLLYDGNVLSVGNLEKGILAGRLDEKIIDS